MHSCESRLSIGGWCSVGKGTVAVCPASLYCFGVFSNKPAVFLSPSLESAVFVQRTAAFLSPPTGTAQRSMGIRLIIGGTAWPESKERCSAPFPCPHLVGCLPHALCAPLPTSLPVTLPSARCHTATAPPPGFCCCFFLCVFLGGGVITVPFSCNC